MRKFKAFITLNVSQKCSVKYYTNAEMLKISKKIVYVLTNKTDGDVSKMSNSI